uniref:Uncharacterized protein n=1 Tax=Neogobius melanostomus TaxID=47308 RepID=A0A8C6TXH9_9GOBI
MSYFCSGIRSSMKPRRSALEMSNTPPTAAVSTPPENERNESNSAHRSHCRGAHPRTVGSCSSRCPGWRGRSGRSPGARST